MNLGEIRCDCDLIAHFFTATWAMRIIVAVADVVVVGVVSCLRFTASGGSILGRNNIFHILAILDHLASCCHWKQTALAAGWSGRMYHSRWVHFLSRH